MGTRTHRIEFVGDEREAVATDVRDGIGEELSGEQADEIVEAVGELVARHIQDHDDADDVVVGVKDLIVEHLIEGGHADAVVMETADVVLKHLPFGSLFIKRALKKIVKGLLGRSDKVVAGVGEIIGEKLIEGDHADDLVREVAELVVETAPRATTPRRSSRKRSTRG